MSRSPEAYLHTPTAYQTDLSCEARDAGTHATLPPLAAFRSKHYPRESIHTKKVHVNSLPVPH
jgi:hypothetical protein